MGPPTLPESQAGALTIATVIRVSTLRDSETMEEEAAVGSLRNRKTSMPNRIFVGDYSVKRLERYIFALVRDDQNFKGHRSSIGFRGFGCKALG